MLKPTGLISGHYECRSFDETLPILKDVLALEVVGSTEGETVLQHPNTAWRLVAHEGGPDSPNKPLRNHYGVRVATNAEVDEANRYLEAKKREYKLKIIKPKEHHNGYSVHFYEPGGNFWEIESYENAVKAGMGGTTDPHWEKTIGEDRFPGKGYVPQALTHGTVEVEDLEASRRFYQECLGLEVVQLWPTSIYVKHPATPWYVVNLQVPPENRMYVGKRQRFTLAMATADEVRQAHDELKDNAGQWGVQEVEDVVEGPDQTSFLFCDRNQNWWEVASPGR